MLEEYNRGDVLCIPVAERAFAVAQIVETLRGNVFLAMFYDLTDTCEQLDVEALSLEDPVFLLETVDVRIQDGSWRIAGHREVSDSISMPTYKVWVEPPGGYYRQDAHGNVLESISPEEARGLKSHRSYSPAAVEAALSGFHNFGPWLAFIDDIST